VACDRSGGYGQWVTVAPTGPGPGPAPAPAPGPAQGYLVNIWGIPGGVDVNITGAVPWEWCRADADNTPFYVEDLVDESGNLVLILRTPPGQQTVTVVCDSSGAVAQTVTVS